MLYFLIIFRRFTEEVALASTPASDGDLPEVIEGELIYIQQIHTMREYEITTLYVDFTHLLQKDDVLADAIQKQYYRFLPYLRRALHNLVAEYEPEYLKINPTAATTDSANLQSREFNIAFYHLPLVSGIRDLRTDKIGTLMSISGTVTRTSEVRPELLYGSFICEVCGGLVNEIEQQFKYTEVTLCPSQIHGYMRLCMSSQVSVLILHVEIASHGSFKLILPNLRIGRRSAYRKIHPRYPPVPCLDLWTLFFVLNLSNVLRQEINVFSLAPLLLFRMSASSDCQVETKQSLCVRQVRAGQTRQQVV